MTMVGFPPSAQVSLTEAQIKGSFAARWLGQFFEHYCFVTNAYMAEWSIFGFFPAW